MNDVTSLAAGELRRLIGAGALSPLEVFDAFAARIERYNPALNALVAMRLEAAREEARAASEALRDGAPLGALHGLPVAIKEAENVAGLPTTKGATIYANRIAARDCRMVELLRAAGAIVIGKSNIPTLTNGLTTENAIYGRTLNPHDANRTCAGSSGGAAVALAADLVPLATGSDTGGSIRGPASVCGISGLRPSPGIVPAEARPLGWNVMTVLGPMARSVDDVALMLHGMTAFDARDPFSAEVDARLLAAPARIDPCTLRVAFSADLGGVVECTDAVRRTFAARVARIAPAFARCDEASPDLSGVHEVYLTLRSLTHMTRYEPEHLADRAGLSPAARTDLRRGDGFSSWDIARAMAQHTVIYRRFQAFFADYDLLLTPGRALPIYDLAEVDRRNAQMAAEEAKARNDLWAGRGNINAPITMMAHPALTMPAGRDADGMPFGIQVVGRYRGDRMLLDACAALERLFESDPELARPRPDLSVF
jgi:Asp-tRNA(Asn)/Glu-tRNA(Gln) amidotransferase A subunit family amidase